MTWRFVFAAALLASSIACRSTPGPNVVFITLDTTRADRLGAMGYAKAETPVLDALAKRGVVYDRAYASSPVTLPSHATLLTGLEPPAHGVHDNGIFVVPDSVDTVAERLKDRGYATAAFVSAFVLDGAFGLAQGFDVYDAEAALDRNALLQTVPRREGDKTTDAALAWLGKRSSAPFFLWVHYYDVHLPRLPPPPYAKIKSRYDGALAFVDAQVGRLLEGVDAASRGRETVVVVTADHGEGLGEHDEWTHGTVAYDSTLHVPLIVAGPGFAPGTRSEGFVRSADVGATLVAAGGARGAFGDGTALQARHVPDETARTGYFETFLPTYNFGWASIAGVRDGRWKFTAEPPPVELYDVVADPKETKNLADSEPDVVARMRALYDERKVDLDAVAAPPGTNDADVSEKLAALGYVAAPRSYGDEGRPDPRTHVGSMSLIEHGRALALRGEVWSAIVGFEKLALDPVIRPLALRALAPLYLTIGRHDEGLAALREIADVTGTVQSRIELASALLALARGEAGLAELDAIPRSATGEESARIRLARAQGLVLTGRFEEAKTEAAELLETDPTNDKAVVVDSQARIGLGGRDGILAEIGRLERRLKETGKQDRFPQTRLLLARLLHEHGRDKEAVALLESDAERPLEHVIFLARIAKDRDNAPKAIELLQEVVRRQPSNQPVLLELADLYDEQKRPSDALALYDKMIAVNPADATLYVDRGTYRGRLGDPAGAEADYRKALELDPKLPEPAMNLAMMLIQRGSKEEKAEAETLLLKAVDLRPDYAKAHFHLARLYRERKDPRAKLHAELAVTGSKREVVLGP